MLLAWATVRVAQVLFLGMKMSLYFLADKYNDLSS
jgi:hypothetical protein